VATEPEHERPTAVYTPRNDDKTRLTLSLLLRNRKKVALLSLFFLTIETVGFQTGPYLTQIGIDHGIGSGTHPQHHLSVIVICGVAYILSVLLTVLVERKAHPKHRTPCRVRHERPRVKVFTHIKGSRSTTSLTRRPA